MAHHRHHRQSTEDDHFIRYNANDGVLLACGGFPGNPYMMEQLDPLGTSVTTACSYSPSDKGYGIRAAVWLVQTWIRKLLPCCLTAALCSWRGRWLCGERELFWRQGFPRRDQAV